LREAALSRRLPIGIGVWRVIGYTASQAASQQAGQSPVQGDCVTPRAVPGRVKAATIHDVAALAGVSVASVSRVLSGGGPVTESTRRKVIRAADALQYVPHSGARSLSTAKTQTIGVILPNLSGELFSELIQGLDQAARLEGYHLIVSSSHGDAEEASAAVRSMRGRVDGLIVASPHLGAAALDAGPAGSTPILLMNGVTAADRPSIIVDNHGAAVRAVEHLIAVGRRRIAHISGPEDHLAAEARLAGYLEVMARASLPPLVIEGGVTHASGHGAGADLVARRPAPDAVFASNDILAVGAMRALQDAGLKVPEDVAIVGGDDMLIASMVQPALTTLRTDIAEAGRRAVRRLVRIAAGGAASSDTRCEIVHPALIVRASSLLSGAPNPGAQSLIG